MPHKYAQSRIGDDYNKNINQPDNSQNYFSENN